MSLKKRRKWQVCCAVLRYISYAKFPQVLEVLLDFHRLFGSRNSRTTSILPPEKLSLANLVPRSLVLRVIVKLSNFSKSV